MATIEDLYTCLIRAGVSRDLDVVAEFRVAPRSRSFEKKIDVAWLRRREDADRFGSLRRWRIVAAFEIEGYDVPLDRLELHTSQFKQLWEEEGERFPCFVPLYTEAFHRADPNWGRDNPERKIQQRVEEARHMSKRSSSATSKTDWSRVRAMADRDIAVAPEHPEGSMRHIVRGIARRGLKHLEHLDCTNGLPTGSWKDHRYAKSRLRSPIRAVGSSYRLYRRARAPRL